MNYVLVAPLPVHSLETGLQHYRSALQQRLGELVAILEAGEEGYPSPELLDEVEDRRQQVTAALALNHRARRGNPRRHRYARLDNDLHAEAYALHRCEVLTDTASLVLAGRDGMLEPALRRPLAVILDHLGRGLETRSAGPEAVSDRAWVDGVQDEVRTLLARVPESPLPEAERTMIAALAYAARDTAVHLDRARQLPLR